MCECLRGPLWLIPLFTLCLKCCGNLWRDSGSAGGFREVSKIRPWDEESKHKKGILHHSAPFKPQRRFDWLRGFDSYIRREQHVHIFVSQRQRQSLQSLMSRQDAFTHRASDFIIPLLWLQIIWVFWCRGLCTARKMFSKCINIFFRVGYNYRYLESERT